MEKLSIFGGRGFIGSNFAKLYPDTCDVLDRDAVSPLEDDALYLISTTHNYNVFDDVHLDINTNLNKLMDVLPRVMGTFNFVSSWFVYGTGDGDMMHYQCSGNPAPEYGPCSPKGFYSITKKAAEDLTVSYCETFNKKYRIMRLCNVVGGDGAAGKKKNAFEFLLGKIKRNEDVDVYIGDNYRNYMHVEDVCRAMKIVMECGKQNEIYNIGFAESYRLEDLLKYAIRISGSTSKINRVEAPAFHKIVQAENFHMSCEKLYKLGFRPTYTPFEAISKIISG